MEITIFENICARIMGGDSLRSILTEDGLPAKSSFFSWLNREANKDHLDQYARACAIRAEGYVEEIVSLADEATGADDAAAQRIKIDARKWVASKMHPKKYGDRLDITTGGDKLGQALDLTQLTNEELELYIALQEKVTLNVNQVNT